MDGPKIPFCEDLHAMKYREPGETFRDGSNRVASTLSDSPEHYHYLREVFLDQRFMAAGRVQAAMGSSRMLTPYNCYVSGTIPDSYTEKDNPELSSIMHRAVEAAKTMRMGGGIGYNFSTLRPNKDLITKLGSQSSGPISFMHIYDAVCRATSSAGHRRGAQMGVLRIDHPDIVEFINAKHDQKTLTGFNMSVAVTDEFMECLTTGEPFQLRFNGKNYREIDAGKLWDMLMRSTWDWGEPGVLFIDTINRMNNLWYCETIAATNPCGEQPLPPFGACLLGSFNLPKYIQEDATDNWSFDWDLLQNDIPHVVRAMDNVVDQARYPLAEQRAEAMSKRRMGLGVTGLANAAETLGHVYGSASFIEFENKVLHFINRECYLASADLAEEKGPFPLYDEERYMAGRFIQSLDDDVRDAMRRHGMRNSHLTSIAPTGTISMTADNVSSGIEPVFAVETQRAVNTPDGAQIVTLRDYGWDTFGTIPKLAGEVTAEEHISVLIAASRHVDSAVSKTCNVEGSMPWTDFKNMYMSAWLGGAKGCTTFNSDGKRTALLTNNETSCEFDPEIGQTSCE